VTKLFKACHAHIATQTTDVNINLPFLTKESDLVHTIYIYIYFFLTLWICQFLSEDG